MLLYAAPPSPKSLREGGAAPMPPPPPPDYASGYMIVVIQALTKKMHNVDLCSQMFCFFKHRFPTLILTRIIYDQKQLYF